MELSNNTKITRIFDEQPNSPFFEVDKISIKENSLNPINLNSSKNNINQNSNIFQGLLFWLGILILLAFLGFNIFKFFGNTSDFFGDILDYLKDILNPILKFFGLGILETSKQTIKVSDTGAKGLIDNISSFSLSGIDTLENNVSSPINKSSKNSNNNLTIEEEKIKEKKNLDSKLDNPNTDNSNQSNNKPPILSDQGNSSSSSNLTESITSTKFKIGNSLPEPDAKTVDFFSNTIKSGKGVCHVGTVNGVRGCLEIDEVSNCPRGYGYVSMSVCREPTLRN